MTSLDQRSDEVVRRLRGYVRVLDEAGIPDGARIAYAPERPADDGEITAGDVREAAALIEELKAKLAQAEEELNAVCETAKERRDAHYLAEKRAERLRAKLAEIGSTPHNFNRLVDETASEGITLCPLPDDPDAGAKLLAGWIGYDWDSMTEGRIGDKGFLQWIPEKGLFQGGKQDLRDLAARIADAAQRPLPEDVKYDVPRPASDTEHDLMPPSFSLPEGERRECADLLDKWADIIHLQSGPFFNEDLRRAASALRSHEAEIARAVEAEREACAQTAELYDESSMDLTETAPLGDAFITRDGIAAAIRSRAEHKEGQGDG